MMTSEPDEQLTLESGVPNETYGRRGFQRLILIHWLTGGDVRQVVHPYTTQTITASDLEKIFRIHDIRRAGPPAERDAAGAIINSFQNWLLTPIGIKMETEEKSQLDEDRRNNEARQIRLDAAAAEDLQQSGDPEYLNTYSYDAEPVLTPPEQYGPDDPEFIINPERGSIIAYNPNASTATARSGRIVHIPGTINDVVITRIGRAAFFAHNNVTSPLHEAEVIIPDSVTYIGPYAFKGSGISSVTIPSSVAAIGYEAFSDNNLRSVTIPGTTNIGSLSFANNDLESVTIESGVYDIGDSAFSNNHLTSVIIPPGVANIENGAFSDNELTTVDIPPSVTDIGENAFSHNKLTSVTIPHGVANIKMYAFYHNDLTSVTIPGTVSRIGDDAFSVNKLTSVTISPGVTDIGDNAFYSNDLTSVTIPDTVTSIGMSAFRTNKLTDGSVIIPSTVMHIGLFAFFDNPDLSEGEMRRLMRVTSAP